MVGAVCDGGRRRASGSSFTIRGCSRWGVRRRRRAAAGKANSTLERVLLAGSYRALPVTDPLDGERVVCYRSFLPAKNALV
jgi:hypothetical protein